MLSGFPHPDRLKRCALQVAFSSPAATHPESSFKAGKGLAKSLAD
jgi:hypothetical protein